MGVKEASARRLIFHHDILLAQGNGSRKHCVTVILLLSSRPIPVCVGARNIEAEAPVCGLPLDCTFVPFLFNIYMKPLGKTICHHKVWYHQYAGHTQFYISTLSQLSNASILHSCSMSCPNSHQTFGCNLSINPCI